MRDGGSCGSQPGDLLVVEVDAVAQPGAVLSQPTDFQVVHGPQAKHDPAEVLLVHRFGQVRVQPDIEPLSHRRAFGHDFLGHRERRAWGQGDLDNGPVAGLVVLANQPFAVRKDRLRRLDRGPGRQPAVVLSQRHGAAGQRGAHAQPRTAATSMSMASSMPSGKR